MKYTIKKSQNHGMVLEKDGVETFCPFQAPLLMPIQNATGGVGMNIVRMPCGTNCPHSKVVPVIDLKDSKNNSIYYEITCGNEVNRFNVEEREEIKEEPKSKLTLV